MKQKITMKFIAEKAGVSVATVSSVMNKSSFVSKELTDRVNKVIKRYNYHKDFLATSLRKRLTRLIGIIIVDLSNPVNASLCGEVEKNFRKDGYSVTISSSELDYNIEKECIDIFIMRNVDGIIIIPLMEGREHYSNLFDSGKPVVILNREYKGTNSDFVMFDSYDAMLAAVDHLVDFGHKKIAYISREMHLSHSARRFKGYLDGLKKNNIDFDETLVFTGNDFSLKSGYEAMQEILELSQRPTAVIAFNDQIAIGAIKAAKDAGLSIPEDISIIGADNNPFGSYMEKPLTTLDSNIKDVAETSYKFLLDRLNGFKGPSRKVFLNRSLIIKETTGPCKKSS